MEDEQTFSTLNTGWRVAGCFSFGSPKSRYLAVGMCVLRVMWFGQGKKSDFEPNQNCSCAGVVAMG